MSVLIFTTEKGIQVAVIGACSVKERRNPLAPASAPPAALQVSIRAFRRNEKGAAHTALGDWAQYRELARQNPLWIDMRQDACAAPSSRQDSFRLSFIDHNGQKQEIGGRFIVEQDCSYEASHHGNKRCVAAEPKDTGLIVLSLDRNSERMHIVPDVNFADFVTRLAVSQNGEVDLVPKDAAQARKTGQDILSCGDILLHEHPKGKSIRPTRKPLSQAPHATPH